VAQHRRRRPGREIDRLTKGLLGPIVIDDLPVPAGVVVRQRIPMVLNDAGNIGYSLNGKSFPATDPIVMARDEWIRIDYMNEGLQIHPMHTHGFGQLIIARDGHPVPQPYWEDTVLVAPGPAHLGARPRDRVRRLAAALPHPHPRRERTGLLRDGDGHGRQVTVVG